MVDSDDSKVVPSGGGEAESRPALAKSDLVVPDQLLPPNLFVLPIAGPVIFPTLMAPVSVTVPRFIASVEEAISRQRLLGLVLTRQGGVTETTSPADLYETGVVVRIMKRLKMPDGSVNLLVHSMKRFRYHDVLSDRPHIVVKSEYLDDAVEKTTELDALTRMVVQHVKRLAEVNPFFTDEMRLAMINAPGPGTVADLVAFALSLPREEAQKFLEILSVKERFERLLVHLRREQDVADLQRKIHDEVNSKINSMQREFFLKEQLKLIKKELGVEEDGRDKANRTFRERIDAAGMPASTRKVALEELEKFETLNENSPEYNISRNYLETLCSLPWSRSTEDQLDMERARKILDEDHFGLEMVKERILETLAVRALTLRRERDGENLVPEHEPEGESKGHYRRGSILCLVGPPGVGKTSIGKSVARTLGRSFYRFSLGGMRDEAEIKGHRRTYVGALPGKVINAMRRAGTKNPVIMLDEIDKLGMSFQGDPASALLEVLDPEQNGTFLDHYLDVPFDLSDVLFVCTANSLASIPAPLLDRMEVIEIPGYTLEEKEKIASRYVIPSVLKKNGLEPDQVRFQRTALTKMMTDYAREPGLRSLQRLVEKIARRAAARVVRREQKGNRKGRHVLIKDTDLAKWLGPKRFYNELAERITSPGVVVGLAWTSAGGDILFIEATRYPGSGQLKLTGQMGEVMSESANIAWSYVKRKLSEEGGMDAEALRKFDVHLHIPAGAIPKDGPSAGVTMASALYSLMTGRIARQRVAMTGELSLIGRVLPVGGIKEKLLAAKRAGINTVILPRLNEKDLQEIPEYALKGMKIHWASHVEHVFDLVLVNRSVKAKPTSAADTRPAALAAKAKPAPAKNRVH
ncbi:MAG TPA: endopeptidase La [Bdellovibrionota bacterium]|jgi:ATP-dependent Lon protease|nr:endopeptidase La [Bdellovibrionota bacterium]